MEILRRSGRMILRSAAATMPDPGERTPKLGVPDPGLLLAVAASGFPHRARLRVEYVLAWTLEHESGNEKKCYGILVDPGVPTFSQ